MADGPSNTFGRSTPSGQPPGSDNEGPIYRRDFLGRADRSFCPPPDRPPPPMDPWIFARLADRPPGRRRRQQNDEFHHPRTPSEEQTIYTPDSAVVYSASQLAYRRRQLAFYAMKPAEAVENDDGNEDNEWRQWLRAVVDGWAGRNKHIVLGLQFFIAGVLTAVREKVRAALTAVIDAVALVLSYMRACIPWLRMMFCVAVPVVVVLRALVLLRTREVGEAVVHYELVPNVRTWSVCCCLRAG